MEVAAIAANENERNMIGRLDPKTKQELRELLGEQGPDALVLVLTNIVVIFLAMAQGWNLVEMLWIFWWQNIIIGFFVNQSRHIAMDTSNCSLSVIKPHCHQLKEFSPSPLWGEGIAWRLKVMTLQQIS